MTRDWQDEAAYRHFDSLDLSGLAWECLRRNSDYRANLPADAGWIEITGCMGVTISRLIRTSTHPKHPCSGRLQSPRQRSGMLCRSPAATPPRRISMQMI